MKATARAATPTLSEYGIALLQLLTGDRNSHEVRLSNRRATDIAPLLTLNSTSRILDIGNGSLQPQAQLLASYGHTVVGIDLVNRPASSTLDHGYAFARWLYRLHLNRRWNGGSLQLAQADASKLPFGSSTFDLISSIAALEHFLDIPAVVSEIERVLKPSGVAWIHIHLFTSPSGGHNVTLTQVPLQHLPSGVEPWDHLRQRKLPKYTPLNEWRIEQYLAAFSEKLAIVKHYCADIEGRHLLTPELRTELSEYSAQELTCGGYTVVAQKST